MSQEQDALAGRLGHAAQSSVLLDHSGRIAADYAARFQLKGGENIPIISGAGSHVVPSSMPTGGKKGRLSMKEYGLQLRPASGGWGVVPCVITDDSVPSFRVTPTIGGLSMFDPAVPALTNYSGGGFIAMTMHYTLDVSTWPIVFAYTNSMEIDSYPAGTSLVDNIPRVLSYSDDGVSFSPQSVDSAGVMNKVLDYYDFNGVPDFMTLGTEAKNQVDDTSPNAAVYSINSQPSATGFYFVYPAT